MSNLSDSLFQGEQPVLGPDIRLPQDELRLSPYLIALNYGQTTHIRPMIERMCLWYEIELIVAGTENSGVYVYDQFIPALEGRIYIRHPGMVVRGIGDYTFRGLIFDSIYDNLFESHYHKGNTVEGRLDIDYLTQLRDLGHQCTLLDEMPPYVDVYDIRRYIDIYTEALHLYVEKTNHAALKYHALIMRLIVYLLEDIENQKRSLIYNSPTRDLAMRMRDYIYDHYMEKITLESLTRVFFLSREHLCRIFKQYFSTPPLQYLTSVRLYYARQMLIYENVSVENIALKCGFSSVQYFYKVFKRTYGFSPRRPK